MKTITTAQANLFRKHLKKWSKAHPREMPWKGVKDPYVIWLSEIILQQTRVQQGLPYFEKFLKKYPTIKHLAKAPDDEVMKMWEGLGYYSRARNLLATARFVADELDGEFPKTYNNVLSLKGVGPYTAAAITSFAYDLPHAVVDGNVYRVISRYAGESLAIDSTEGKKAFNLHAELLLDQKNPAAYNQSIMDFGATHCLPQNPLCTTCGLKKNCVAFQQNEIEKYPFKSKKIKKRTRYFNFLVVNYKDQIAIRKRVEKDIWNNLFEFPLIESASNFDKDELQETNKWQSLFLKHKPKTIRQSLPFKQQLTHQKIIATFWEIELNKKVWNTPEDYVFVPENELRKYAFPKVIDCYLTDNSLNLYLN